MQESLWFENQIIKPSNLDFMNDSTAKNVTDVVTAFTKGQPGVVAGLSVDAALSIGSAVATITAGYGFLANGERVQLFSPSGVTTLPYSGTTSIYASLVEVNYNPDPSENPLGNSNVASGLNAASLDYEAVEQYNLLNLTTLSGASYIKLADVTTNFGIIQSIDYTNRQNLKIGEIDLFSNSIDGSIITPSSIDSNQFVSPLHYNIAINSGVSIDYLGSGVNHIASATNPIGSIFAVSGTFHDLSGFSPILIDSMTQKSGTSLESNGSYVSIDTANKGTQLGGGMILSGSSIDLTSITNPANANLSIKLNPAADVNVNAKNINLGGIVNVGAGGINVAGGNINVTGGGQLNVPFFTVNTLGVNGTISGSNTVFQGSVSVSGNIVSSGNLAFGHTDQSLTNVIPNGFMYPSGNNTFSGTNIPGVWSGTNPYGSYVLGPITNPANGAYLTFPTALNTWLQGRSQYTFEWVFKSNLVGTTRLLALRNNAPTQNMRVESTSNQFYLYNENTGYPISPDATTNVVANAWTHFALAVSGTTASIYINGLLKKTNTSAQATIGSSVTQGHIGAYDTDSSAMAQQFYKAFKVSSKAHSVFPSGLTNLNVDADTVALYNFDNVPSGINAVPASGLGNLISQGAIPMGFYEAPSGTASLANTAFIGQSFSGSTVLDYTRDVVPAGSVNVFSGATNSPYFFLVSGNNLIGGNGFGYSGHLSGVSFSTPLDAQIGASYNISYYTKMISGSAIPFFAPDANAVGVRAYVRGSSTGYVSPVFSGSQLVGEWTRNSFSFTPTTVEPLDLYLNFYSASGNTISGASVFGISSVQATRGTAQLEPTDSSPKAISIIHSNLDGVNLASPAANALATATTNVYYSGSVYSDGAMATVQPQLNFIAYKNTNGVVQGYWLIPKLQHIVTLNGAEIINETIQYQSVQSSSPTHMLNLGRNWTGYLRKGRNDIVSKLLLWYVGDTSTCTWFMNNQLVTASNIPKTNITIH
jgi:hypothetical protein